MADAEDLKSSGDFSSCGFDSHPGHQSFSAYILTLRKLSDSPEHQPLRSWESIVACRERIVS